MHLGIVDALEMMDDQEIVLGDLKMVVAVQRIVHVREIVRGDQEIVRGDQETVDDLLIDHDLGIVVADQIFEDDR